LKCGRAPPPSEIVRIQAAIAEIFAALGGWEESGRSFGGVFVVLLLHCGVGAAVCSSVFVGCLAVCAAVCSNVFESCLAVCCSSVVAAVFPVWRWCSSMMQQCVGRSFCGVLQQCCAVAAGAGAAVFRSSVLQQCVAVVAAAAHEPAVLDTSHTHTRTLQYDTHIAGHMYI